MTSSDLESAKISKRGAHWYRQLRKESLIAARQVTIEQPPAESTLPGSSDTGIRLIGTILETGNSFAMVVDVDGRIDLQPEGGVLQIDPNGIRVERINHDSIVVSRNGTRETLFMSKVVFKADEEDDSAESMSRAGRFFGQDECFAHRRPTRNDEWRASYAVTT